MSTGTPRPTYLKSQSSSDAGKAWMSFEESPVHPSGNVRQDERWTSFADATPPVDQNIQLQLTSPGPNFSGQPLIAIVPQIQSVNQQPRGKDASILNRTGIGTEGQHSQQLPLHTGAQPVNVTHGPGSTISHILRHKSGDADHEHPVDNRTLSSKHHQSEGVLDPRDIRLANMPQKKPVEPNQAAEKYYAAGGKPSNRANDSGGHDPWFVTEEQSTYYRNQFATMQPNIDGKIDGQTARNFFTKSRLPIPELSHIWELCDMDQDGHLTLIEFCAAFHLVVARKNNYDLPAVLPKTLLPPLMKMCGISHQSVFANRNLMATTDVPTSEKTNIIDFQRKEEAQAITQMPVITNTQSSEPKNEEPVPQKPQLSESNQWQTHEKWETFSDRTSSSTNLANFDQSLDHTQDNLIHPVALRMTPSKHEVHSAKMRKVKAPPKSTDDDEHHGLGVPPSHKSLTNPYGPLQNNLSEPDSHRSPRARSSSNSSHSSAGTSDRSLSEIDPTFKAPKLHTSDQEYQSDWSSRPLQPRSASDSSMDSSSLEPSVIAHEAQGSVPTPPPRPNQQLRATKSDSYDGEHQHHSANDVPDSALAPMAAPTPPPRPQQSTAAKQTDQNEGFADFSQFEKNQIEESSTKEPEAATAPVVVPEPAAPQPEDKPNTKPTPAPRHSREDKGSKQEVKEEKSPDKNIHRKAPTKPPRSRIQSVDSAIQEHSKIIKSNSVTSPSDNIPVIPEKPSQRDAQSKLLLQQSIRDLKLQNSKLTKLNADLQQELKDVMQSRITVEMSIHHLRPFTQ